MNKGRKLSSNESEEEDINARRQIKNLEKKKTGLPDKTNYLEAKINESEKKTKEKFDSFKEDKLKSENEKNPKESDKIPLINSSLDTSALITSHIADKQVDSQSADKILKWISFIYYRQEKMDKKLDDILEILKSKNFKNSEDEA